MPEEPAKILIVDDDEDITVTISDYFNSLDLGITPIATSDPRQVMTILEEHQDIRLILSDFRMPGINGFELLMMVKAKYPKVLFVMMTGYSTQELKREGFKRGAIRYIEKPFDLGELAEIIRDALKGASAGFGGLIESIQLPDIIQLIGMSRRTVTLNINADQGKASIFFNEGEIVHASTSDNMGDDAFYEIFLWTGGRFTFAPIVGETEQTIDQSWQGLLIEAARREDEANMPEAGADETSPEASDSFEMFESLEPDADEDGASPKPIIPEDEDVVADEGTIETDSEGVDQEMAADDAETAIEPPQPALESETDLSPTETEAEEKSSESSDLVVEEEQPEQVAAEAAEISTSETEGGEENSEAESEGTDTDFVTSEISEPADIATVEVPPDRVLDDSEMAPDDPSSLQKDESVKTSADTDTGGPETEKRSSLDITAAIRNKLIDNWPSGEDSITYAKAGIEKLPVSLTKHFHYEYRNVLEKLFNIENAPFDFEGEDLSNEFGHLSKVLLSNWQITRDFYQETLDEAINYEVERAIDPVKAFVAYIDNHTSGVASQIRELFKVLIEYELVDEIFSSLDEDLKSHGDKRIHSRQLVYLGRAILYRHDEESGFTRMRQALINLMTLSGQSEEGAGGYSLDIIIGMLEAHGVVQLADYIRNEIKPGRDSLNLEQLDEVMDRYRRYSDVH